MVYHSVAPPTNTVAVMVTMGSARSSHAVLADAVVTAVPKVALASSIVWISLFIMLCSLC